ncbi:MAG: Rad52/Rad22 family DNA repair protein [Fusobacterium sp.]|nr:hypothetical protein [Fusobacterium sp.]
MKGIYEKLKEKFDEKDLEFRVGATNSDKTMGLALAYVQARAIQNRLDEVVGFENWKVSYKEIQGGFLCTLSIRINDEWIEKEDGASVTEFESVKGGISNAFKRVASSGFGIGRYLYNARNSWYPIKPQGKGFVFAETPKLQLNEDQPKAETKPEVELSKNTEIIITFGKYKGQSLTDIYHNDRSYIKYLRDKSKDADIIKECEKLLVS